MDNGNAEWYKRINWKVWLKYAGLVAGIVLIAFLFFGGVMESCGEYLFRKDINSRKANVNRELQNANIVKGELENLKIQEKLKEAEVNRARDDYIRSAGETDNARELTNKQLKLANAVEASSYANKTVRDALEAQCRAFPDSPDCQK